MQNFLLYDASGGMPNSNECRFALLKLLSAYNLKPPGSLSIVVYSRHPRLFDDFLNFFPQLEIKVPANGFPQKKAELIQEFFSATGGNLLLCDTATYPLQPLDALFSEIGKGILFLYKDEIARSNGVNSILLQLQSMAEQQGFKTDGIPKKAGKVTVFHTAVVGLSQSAVHTVENASNLMSQLSRRVSHPVVEQFVFTHAFQKRLPVNTANDYFADYFALPEFCTLIDTFFTRNAEESIPNLVKLVHYLDAAAIHKEKMLHDRLPVLKKIWKNITGKGWSIKKYEKRI